MKIDGFPANIEGEETEKKTCNQVENRAREKTE
jgi:hypothetical protein